MKINVCRLKSQTEKLDQVSVLLFFFCHSLHTNEHALMTVVLAARFHTTQM